MKGDFSRWTFDPHKYFSRVLLQQGRVLLDADWNEQNAILLGSLQQVAADLIGPHGGPREYCGFRLTRAEELSQPERKRLEDLKILPLKEGDGLIGPGRYYVDGVGVETPEYVAYTLQPYLPGLEVPKSGRLLVYLDLWERHITPLEDPYIREVALGGADTCTRAQLIWQVKLLDLDDPGEEFSKEQQEALKNLKLGSANCDNFPLAGFRQALSGNPPLLKARALQHSGPDTDPCLTPPEARYRGQENQLYRVEVHKGGPAGEATFKWSRENGSVLGGWTATQGNRLSVSGIHDSLHGFEATGWVELTHDDYELQGKPGTLVQLSKVEGDQLTLNPATANGTLPVSSDPVTLHNPKIRRWDQRKREDLELTGGAILIEEGSGEAGWIELENGIQVQFQAPAQGQPPHLYRSGDYWFIPARTATGDVEWPGDPDNPQALPPQGIQHHYAPLALAGTATGGLIHLRRAFSGLAVCIDEG